MKIQATIILLLISLSSCTFQKINNDELSAIRKEIVNLYPNCNISELPLTKTGNQISSTIGPLNLKHSFLVGLLEHLTNSTDKPIKDSKLPRVIEESKWEGKNLDVLKKDYSISWNLGNFKSVYSCNTLGQKIVDFPTWLQNDNANAKIVKCDWNTPSNEWFKCVSRIHQLPNQGFWISVIEVENAKPEDLINEIISNRNGFLSYVEPIAYTGNYLIQFHLPEYEYNIMERQFDWLKIVNNLDLKTWDQVDISPIKIESNYFGDRDMNSVRSDFYAYYLNSWIGKWEHDLKSWEAFDYEVLRAAYDKKKNK